MFERCLAFWVLVGVLVEVPVLLSVCAACNRTRHWFAATCEREKKLVAAVTLP